MMFRPLEEKPKNDSVAVIFRKDPSDPCFCIFEYDLLDRSWWEVAFAGNPDYQCWAYLDDVVKHAAKELGK